MKVPLGEGGQGEGTLLFFTGMDSCFGARSLFGGHSSTDTLFSSTQLEVIQDLDLYFIRQIAHSLGVSRVRWRPAYVRARAGYSERLSKWMDAVISSSWRR